MKKSFNWKAALAPFAVLAIPTFCALMGTTTPARADSLCKNVKFEYVNQHSSGQKIQVIKVEYWDNEDGKWRTEDVQNEDCAQGATCMTNGDDLAYVGNEAITKIKFHFQYWAAGQWSGTVITSERSTSGMTSNTCVADKVYRQGPGVPFPI